MILEDANFQIDKHREQLEHGFRASLRGLIAVFFIALLVLLVGMSLHLNVYDEGIVLTGSMRVAAGQVPHRDFYSIYGPAELYILAALFKIFGQAILIERILDLICRALIVTSVYAIASLYVRNYIAAWTSAATLVWLFASFSGSGGSALLPISLLNLVSTALILPVFIRPVSFRRVFAVGALSGLTMLFRYDTGIALFCVHICMIAIAIGIRLRDGRVRAFATEAWPYLIGFGIVVLFPALYYLSVAPIHPLLHDVVIFPGRYYSRARGLPFPKITLKGLDNFAVYLPLVILGLSLYAIFNDRLRRRGTETPVSVRLEKQRRLGFLIAFGLLALSMYFKGIVRVSVVQMYLSTIPSILLLALLFERRMVFRRPLQLVIVFAVGLSLLSPAWSSLRAMRDMYVQHSSLPEHVWESLRGTSSDVRSTWCHTPSPLTKGLCFLPEDYRIQTIEFIESHTRPGQPLFVGVTRHDRIFANDNLIYFATKRLPATRWSHFDPDLQTSLKIQTQMVHELEVAVPPYVVIDAEFDSAKEPNDSSRSSGVTVLDDYLHKDYQPIQKFGQMSIWQRKPVP